MDDWTHISIIIVTILLFSGIPLAIAMVADTVKSTILRLGLILVSMGVFMLGVRIFVMGAPFAFDNAPIISIIIIGIFALPNMFNCIVLTNQHGINFNNSTGFRMVFFISLLYGIMVPIFGVSYLISFFPTP
jgi:hypothetical protein